MLITTNVQYFVIHLYTNKPSKLLANVLGEMNIVILSRRKGCSYVSNIANYMLFAFLC